MKLEVLSTHSNATNWIIMGLKRRIQNINEATDEICEEVAEELGFEFKKKDDNIYYFGDKQ